MYTIYYDYFFESVLKSREKTFYCNTRFKTFWPFNSMLWILFSFRSLNTYVFSALHVSLDYGWALHEIVLVITGEAKLNFQVYLLRMSFSTLLPPTGQEIWVCLCVLVIDLRFAPHEEYGIVKLIINFVSYSCAERNLFTNSNKLY